MFASSGHNYISSQSSGSNLYIRNTGGGQILIRPKTGEEGIKIIPDGAVQLYHDNALKLTTTAGGAYVSGTFGTGHINLDGELNFTTNGSKYIDVYTLANSNTFNIRHHNPSGNLYEMAFQSAANGATTLYYDGSAKFNTSATGATITGNLVMGGGQVKFADGGHVMLGDSNDLRLYHDGSNSYIANDTTGDFYIQQNLADKDLVLQCDNGSGGTTQYIRLDGSAGLTQFDKDTKHTDTIKATFGNSADLQIYHGGGSSFIKDDGDGGLYLQTNGPAIYLQDTDGNALAQFTDGGANFLMYDGATKFQTSATGATVTGNLVMGSGQVKFADSGHVMLGDSNDLRLYHDGSNSHIQQVGTGALIISHSVDNADIRLQASGGSGSASDYIILDSSQTSVRLKRKTKLDDSLDLCFGDGEDLKIGFDGTNSTFSQTDGDMRFIQYTDNKMIRFYSDDGSGGVSEYFRVDGSANNVNFSATAHFVDGAYAAFGGGHDLQIWHDGTNSNIQNNTGDLAIINTSDDKDIIFKCDDGSGGVATYFSLDGSGAPHPRTTFPDNSTLQLGSGGDFQMFNDSADTIFAENTRNLHIRNNANGGKIIFESDDGSTGTTEYFRIDGTSEDIQARKDLMVSTGKSIYFNGTSGLRMLHDGSNSIITNESTGNLTIQNSATDKDIVFKCDNGSGGSEIYFFLDGSLSGGDPFTVFPDDSYLAFGPDADMTLHHDGTDSKIRNQTGNLVIEQNANDKDIVFKCDDGSGGTTEYFYLDGSAGNILFGKELRLLDGVQIQLGTSLDMLFMHNGANGAITNNTGNLIIKNQQDDGNIIFECDDGSGGIAEYFRVDGDLVLTKFLKHTRHNDGINAYFGDDNDLLVGHNGTIGTIQAQTGDLQFKALGSASDLTFYAASTMMLSLDGGREVVHHHRGVEYNTVHSNNSDYTVGTANHIILMHSMSAGRTVTIPTSECNNGRVLIIKDRDGQAAMHNITIATQGSETIDGAATKVINSGHGSVTLVSDGSNWSII